MRYNLIDPDTVDELKQLMTTYNSPLQILFDPQECGLDVDDASFDSSDGSGTDGSEADD